MSSSASATTPRSAEPQSAPARRPLMKLVFGRLEMRMLGLALLIAIALSLLSPYFLTTKNLLNLLDQSVVIGIVSIGMTFVILTGGIDLSVGAVAGVAGVVFGITVPEYGLPLASLFAVATGAVAGLISGVLIAQFGLAAFVVTLGMMAIGRSLCFILSGAQAITTIPVELNDLIYLSVFGLRANVALLIAAYVLAWLYLSYAKGGRTIYAIGSNRDAARAAGLDVTFYSILPYVVSGTLAAAAMLLVIGQVLTVDPLAGNLMELDAIATVVIGGASLYGGRGSVIGTLMGVVIMVMIRNGLNLMGVSPFWQGTAIGLIIICAVLAERLMSDRQAR